MYRVSRGDADARGLLRDVGVSESEECVVLVWIADGHPDALDAVLADQNARFGTRLGESGRELSEGR